MNIRTLAASTLAGAALASGVAAGTASAKPIDFGENVLTVEYCSVSVTAKTNGLTVQQKYQTMSSLMNKTMPFIAEAAGHHSAVSIDDVDLAAGTFVVHTRNFTTEDIVATYKADRRVSDATSFCNKVY